jgi:hypothetical protein
MAWMRRKDDAVSTPVYRENRLRWAGMCLPAVLVYTLTACAQAPAAAPPPVPVARATALGAARTLIPYTDPLHTFRVERPQTWVALDAHSAPQFAAALGDSVRFFEPINASDPDAGSSGKLWIDVLPAHGDTLPRQLLLQPFIAADYPAGLLARMAPAPTTLGGIPAYRLVTLAGKAQARLLLARWRDHYYRVTIFGATVPAEVAPVLRSWRFLDESPHGDA